VRQPLLGIVGKGDGLGSGVEESHISERQFCFELPLHLFRSFLTVAHALRFGLPVMIDEHVPFTVFLADFDTHTAFLLFRALPA